MSETKEKLTRIRAVRGGNRGVVTKLINEVEGQFKEEYLDRGRLKTITGLLEEKLTIIKALDEKVIEICDVDDIENEIIEADELISRVLDTQRKIHGKTHDEVKNEVQPKEPDNVSTPEQQQTEQESPENVEINENTESVAITTNVEPILTGTVNQQISVHNDNPTPVLPPNRSRLPKLVLPKFRGEITQWRTFWDSFNSAIHTNSYLSQIDKFNHLNSLLEGQALRAIQGLPLSENNYQSAIDILHQRFGKTQQIISTHMDELLKIPACTGDKASQLRFVYDKISINVRGLDALGVDSSQYGSLLIPVVMSKLPQDVRIQIARNTVQDVWEMSGLLNIIRNEVEAREVSESIKINPEKPKPPITKPSTAAALLTNGIRATGNQMQCVYCSGYHYSASCNKVSDPHSRLEILKKDGRCFVCIKLGHRSNQCPAHKPCRRCNGRHHQSICNQQLQAMKPRLPNPNESTAQGRREQEPRKLNPQVENQAPNTHTIHVQQTTTTTSAKAKGGVMLQTATVTATNEDGSKSMKVKVLFDSGSQRSYVTDNLKARLCLRSKKTETLHLNTFGERNYRKQKCVVVTLLLGNNNGECVSISALNFPVICSPLATKIEVDNYPHLQGLQLADSSDSNDSIDVLIGSDHYWDIVNGTTVRGEFGPVAINSKFGWLLSGPANDSLENETTITNLTISGNCDIPFETSRDPVVDTLRKFWDTESIGIKSDQECKDSIETFNESVHFNGERYEVELPWKKESPTIPSDYLLCANRLRSLQRKMLHQPELLREYDEIIQEQIQNGIVEKIPDEEITNSYDDSVHYLPHHAIIRRDRETTKLRIVYDGSAKSPDREYSLNDCLETGPNFTPQLFDTLIKFRWHKIGLTADIEKAFLMVAINDANKNMLRFLWLKEPNKLNSELVQLRFTRLVFGLRPSPAILGSTIHHHLDTQKESDPQLIELLKNSFYVDDLVSGADNDKAALELASNAKLVMQKGAFNLRKWNTNSSYLKEKLLDDKVTKEHPTAPTTKSVTEEDESYAKTVTGPSNNANNDTVKVLGTIWNTTSDQLEFNFSDLANHAKSLPATKRSLLKISAKIFDPLGLLGPFIIQWKVLFQILCNKDVDWDEALSEEHLSKFNLLISELQALNTVCVPRCYFEMNSHLLSSQLHCFSDASMKAYAAAIYLRSIYSDGHVDVNLITAKTRVAPLTKQSIPRLELLGANILVRLANTVKNALPLAEEVGTVYWVDSMTVLYWIKNSKPWKQYVMSRVKEIREGTTRESWRHCPGVQNPADLPSRGMKASELVEERRWWKGPEFLYKPESEWPKEVDIKETEYSMNEVVKNPTMVTHTLTTPYRTTDTTELFSNTDIGVIINCNRFNSKPKLLRVTALVLRAVRIMKRRETAKGSNQLNAEILKEAERLWIRSIQSSTFTDEIQGLNTRSNQRHQLISQLNLFLDDNRLIRCEGRLENSNIPAETKNPILLPSKHRFTELVIQEEHKRVHHNGIKQTLNCIRETFWILRGRESVKRVLRKCIVCKKLEGISYATPKEPSLPSSRVSDEPPFANTGIDFAGPLLIKENERTEKSYVCLFTCASTRAVHLELLRNLSTDMFLQSFRRFVSRRGIPKKLISDNAKTFKAAAKEVIAISRAENVQRYLADQGVTWDFITERAPWHGGFWERLIKSTKRCLKKSIGRASLTFEELRTILVEIEGTLNNRPLTYIYDDEQGISYPLTPACLIYGRRIATTPNDSHYEIVSTNKSLTRRAKYQVQVLKSFTDQWRKEYLLSIRESSRSNSGSCDDIAKGDIVILKNDSTPRIFWRLAKIESLIRSDDNVVRSAKVKVLKNDNKNGIILRRPIQHLIPLEIQGEPDELNESKVQQQPKADQPTTRSRRNAAVLGELKRRKCR